MNNPSRFPFPPRSLLPLRAQGWPARIAKPKKHVPQSGCVAKGCRSGDKAPETNRNEHPDANGRRNIVKSQKLEISPGKPLTDIYYCKIVLFEFLYYFFTYGCAADRPKWPCASFRTSARPASTITSPRGRDIGLTRDWNRSGVPSRFDGRMQCLTHPGQTVRNQALTIL